MRFGNQRYRNFAIWGLLFTIQLMALPAYAVVKVENVRMWRAPDNTRLVLDLSGPVEHNLFSLKHPERIVVDLSNSHFRGNLPTIDFANSSIRKIRYAQRKANSLRFVLDLQTKVSPKSFVLKPHGEYGHRLVIDLQNKNTSSKRILPTRPEVKPDRARDIIIAIDAGHGGEDPGAIGRRGTREKDVVLAIARKLAEEVRKEKGMRPVLIRNGDYYVGLRQRAKKAHQQRADLFISIHADAFTNRKARGCSVFVLSNSGASSEVASFLARSENNADSIGGVSLEDKGELLKMVLVDMVKNSTLEESHTAAASVLKGLSKNHTLHKRRVEQAGFRVLKSPDVPSILIETAFISNPDEEKKLRSPRHQRIMARSIMQGIRSYFRANPPPNTKLAMIKTPRKHRISRGDTLSALAQRYQVSVKAIRKRNALRHDQLRIGKVIEIPYT